MQQNTLVFFDVAITTPLYLPLLGHRIAAGFPSPADDYLEGRIDPNELLIENPAATFIAQVSGDSMKNAGIHDRDYIVVNRAAKWADGSIVVARIHDDFTLKRIRKVGDRVYLVPENPDFQSIEVNEDSDCEIFGCVTGSFRKY
jgi:DNA polymerase V